MLREMIVALSAAGMLVSAPMRDVDAAAYQDRGRAGRGLVEGRSIDTTFRMDKGGVVDLQVAFGNMTVTGATGNDVRIRATTDQGRVRLRASSTLATLRATGDHGPPGGVRYEVSVPAGIRVLMRATNGNLTATGVKGDIEAENIHGTILLTDVSGLARIESVSGNVVASRLVGDIHIDAMSGGVSITDAEGEITVDNTSGPTTLTDIRSSAVRVESVSGQVRYQGTIERTGRYDFESHSGNITLTLPPSAGAVLTLSTYSGSLDTDFPITLQQSASGREEKQLQFRLGTGGARISAESFSGNITITRGTARDRQE